MQSKTSFFNLGLFKKNISRTWIVGLLYFVFLTIMHPIMFVINMTSFDNWYAGDGYTRPMMMYMHFESTYTTWFTSILAIVVAGITFWYLFFKRDNFMMHAFPVSRKSLFFTGVLSSLVITVVPLLLNGVIMSIVALSERAYAFDVIWFWTLTCIVETILFLSIAYFSLMTSGQVATAVVFYFIFNVLYELMELAFRMTAGLLMFGMENCTNYMEYNPLSPIFFIDREINVSTKYSYNQVGRISDFSYTLAGEKYLIIYTIAAIAITAIAFMLYKAKKLETVNDFIAVPFLKPVFTVGMSFFISMVAGAFVASMVEAVKPLTYATRFGIAIISTLIIGCILFYATQMMIEKTVRVFSAQKFAFMLGYTVVALVMMLCMRFDAFGVEDFVPKAEDVVWVGVDSSYTETFYDEEDINSLLELHKNFLANKKELRDVNTIYSDVPGAFITFKYKMKNGSYIGRTYSVVDTESDQVSATYVASTEPILDFLNNPTRIKQHIIGNIWDDCTITQMSFSNYYYDETLGDFINNSASFDNLTEKEQHAKYKRVYEAVLKDIDEGRLFQTSFGHWRNEGDETVRLYNDFSFTVENKNVPYYSDEENFYSSDYNYDREPYYEQSIYVTLYSDCENTLKALTDEGFIYSENDEGVITWSQYNKKLGLED